MVRVGYSPATSAPRPLARLTFYTGTDAKMLPQSFMLLQSLKEIGAADDLVFCDLGLSPGQRRALARCTRLAVLPPLPQSRRHPWMYKASLGEFAGNDAETIVWLDADMVALRDPRPELGAIVDDMGRRQQTIAACNDYPSLTLDRFVLHCHGAGAQVDEFTRALEQWRVDRAHEYLNSGLFVARSRRWLKDWRRATYDADQKEHLFEQNAFNVLAWRAPATVRLLDLRQWNVHGPILERVSVDNAGTIRCYDEEARIIHCTGIGDKFTTRERVTWASQGNVYSGELRLFRHPALREIQRGLFSRFVRENPELAGTL